MEIIALLRENTALFLAVVGFFSLIVGSFLNAAIYRIPIMLKRGWREECEALFGGEKTEQSPVDRYKTFNLFVPRSQCPHCGHMITASENIPLFSYLFLKGKCSSCKTGISIQYPLIEVGTALLSAFVAWKVGFGWETVAALILTWTLITLSMIDAKTMLLPDNLTLPLLWLGIAVNYHGLFIDLQSSILGAMVGYLSLWSLYHVFRLITGKEGMGYGDFKILAAIGAWGGWYILPFTVFAASFFGAFFGITWMLLKGSKESLPIPFGPWLAVAGFVGFLWREEIGRAMTVYFGF